MKKLKFKCYLVSFIGSYSQEVIYDIWTRKPQHGSDTALVQEFEIEREVDESVASTELVAALELKKESVLAAGQAAAVIIENKIQSLLALPNK